MKLLAFLDELYQPHPSGGYVSRAPSGKFFRFLRPGFDDISLMVPCGSRADRPLTDWAIVTDNAGFPVVPLPEWRSMIEFTRSAFRLVPQVVPVVRREVSNHDIVWIRMPSIAGILLYREARRQRKPVLMHLAANERIAWKGERTAWMRFVKMLLGETLSAITHRMCRYSGVLATGKELYELYKPSSSAIREFVDGLVSQNETQHSRSEGNEARPRGDEKARLEILYVGRLVESKGILQLAQAVSALSDEGLRLRLRIAGYGGNDVTERVRRLIHDPEGLELLGYVPHGPRLFEEYRRADLFVLPTTTWPEGLPRVLIEAMSFGVPVVASDIGGVTGLVEDERSGLVVQPGSASDLIQAIKRLALKPDLRSKFSREGIAAARAYSGEAQAARVFEVLDELRSKVGRR